MIVVGSKAMKYRFPSLDRQIKDVDIIGTYADARDLIEELQPEKVIDDGNLMSLLKIQNKNEIFDKQNVEILISDNSNSLKGYSLYQKLKYPGELFAGSEILFSLKKSHIHFPIKFNKHITDFVYLNNYFQGVDVLKEITKSNFEETEKRIGKLKTPSLNKSVKKFFDQSKSLVKSYFIHDDMHKAVAHYEEPLYLRMQYDKSIAKCEKVLWEQFTLDDKCKCVLEEAYVIALERKVLPAIFGSANWYTAEEALDWSLMRICTTLCSGWFREFATVNYFEIKRRANLYYVEDFLTKYHNGEIQKIDD